MHGGAHDASHHRHHHVVARHWGAHRRLPRSAVGQAMTFRVGQKVVCVDVPARNSWALYPWPACVVLGGVYTVRSLDCIGDFYGLTIDEYPPPIDNQDREVTFNTKRFRPVVERKTSIEIFERMLKPARQDA